LDEDEVQKENSMNLERTKGMMDINNYYDKKLKEKGEIKVKKLEFKIYPILNGVENRFFYHDIKKGDFL